MPEHLQDLAFQVKILYQRAVDGTANFPAKPATLTQFETAPAIQQHVDKYKAAWETALFQQKQQSFVGVPPEVLAEKLQPFAVKEDPAVKQEIPPPAAPKIPADLPRIAKRQGPLSIDLTQFPDSVPESKYDHTDAPSARQERDSRNEDSSRSRSRRDSRCDSRHQRDSYNNRNRYDSRWDSRYDRDTYQSSYPNQQFQCDCQPQYMYGNNDTHVHDDGSVFPRFVPKEFGYANYSNSRSRYFYSRQLCLQRSHTVLTACSRLHVPAWPSISFGGWMRKCYICAIYCVSVYCRPIF
jgi:hypothetical protein